MLIGDIRALGRRSGGAAREAALRLRAAKTAAWLPSSAKNAFKKIANINAASLPRKTALLPATAKTSEAAAKRPFGIAIGINLAAIILAAFFLVG